MSRSDARRLMADLAVHDHLVRELAACERDTSAWRRRAAELGYELTEVEAEELLARRELGDDDLEQVAGGWEDGGDGSGDGTGGTGGTGGSTGGGG